MNTELENTIRCHDLEQIRDAMKTNSGRKLVYQGLLRCRSALRRRMKAPSLIKTINSLLEEIRDYTLLEEVFSEWLKENINDFSKVISQE
jgi:hypothetical protein